MPQFTTEEISTIIDGAIATGREVERERCAAIVEQFHDAKVVGFTPGPDANPQSLAESMVRITTDRIAEAIRKSE